MSIFTKVGSKNCIGLHELRAVPTVKGKVLNTDSFSGNGATNLHDDNDAIAIVMMIEKVGDVSTLKEYEQASIMAHLHDYHSDARKEEEGKCPVSCFNKLFSQKSKEITNNLIFLSSFRF